MHEFAVYIGRFQPFHNAHLESVKFALQNAKQVVVVVGSDNQARTIKNPLTSAERISMINGCFSPEERKRLIFVPAKDYLYNDNMWIASVQQDIDDVCSGATDVVLVGHKKDASSAYLKLFPQWEFLPIGFNMPLDATHVRDLMFSLDKIGIKNMVPPNVFNELSVFMETPEFKVLHEEHHHMLAYKAKWKGAPFPPIFVTVDAVVVCSGHVLVVRRRFAPGKGLIALPGGFLSQDEKIIDGCVRELKEETGISIPQAELKENICDQRVFDHPGRSLRGRTITHAFCINLGHGPLPKVKGMDDAAKAWWTPLRDVFSKEDQFFEDHFHIINYFVTRF